MKNRNRFREEEGGARETSKYLGTTGLRFQREGEKESRGSREGEIWGGNSRNGYPQWLTGFATESSLGMQPHCKIVVAIDLKSKS